MRNYVESFYATVIYAQKNPNPPPDTLPPVTQYFIAGSEEASLSQGEDFIALLDPDFYVVVSYPLSLGPIYWLLNKENFLELVNGVPGWWNFVGTSITDSESPRKSWSHGH